MKKFAVFLLTLLLLGCFVSAGAAEETTHTEATVFAKCGEMIIISAVGNPTTGYSWSEPEVSNGLEVVFSEYTQYNPGMIGKGGVFEWGVTAASPGFYQFKTDYNRAWEKAPAKTLKAMFVYFPEFMNIQSGVVSIRAF